MFKTKEIVAATQATLLGPAQEVHFKGVSQNSKTINSGELFVAIQGERFDGHHFLKEVFERGVQAALIQKGKVKKEDFPGKFFFEVKDSIAALGELANYHRKKFKIPVIGITGSNGKTTTKDLTAHLLTGRYHVLKTLGNQNNLIGLPFTLFRLDSTQEISVLEMGMSIPFEIKRLAEIAAPSAGLITNIGDTHLKTMGSQETIAKAKGALFEALPKQGMAFINIDDPHLKPYVKKIHSQVFTYSLENEGADLKGEILEDLGLGGFHIRVFLKENVEEKIDFFLPLPGVHNVMNALVAISVALHFKVEKEKIIHLLSSFQAAQGRSKVIHLNRGITLIDDSYNANPSSMAAALRLLERGIDGPPEASAPSIYAVLGDMLECGDQEKQYHQQLGLLLGGLKIDNLLTFGSLSQYIVETARNKNKKLKAFWTNDREELISELKQRLSSELDAVILIKGSHGMRMDLVVEALVKAIGQKVN